MIDEFFSSIEAQICFKDYRYYTLYEINEESLQLMSTHKRVKLFNKLGFECKHCGVIAIYMAIGNSKRGADHSNTLTLYTKDFEELTVDHIIPLSQGGSPDGRPNKQCLCYSCNQHKSDKIVTTTTCS